MFTRGVKSIIVLDSGLVFPRITSTCCTVQKDFHSSSDPGQWPGCALHCPLFGAHGGQKDFLSSSTVWAVFIGYRRGKAAWSRSCLVSFGQEVCNEWSTASPPLQTDIFVASVVGNNIRELKVGERHLLPPRVPRGLQLVVRCQKAVSGG